MIAYQGAERELYTEALRTFAAMSKARARQDSPAVIALYQAYARTARELGVPPVVAYSISTAACTVLMASLVTALAEEEGTDSDEVTQRLIETTVEMVASGAL